MASKTKWNYNQRVVPFISFWVMILRCLHPTTLALQRFSPGKVPIFNRTKDPCPGVDFWLIPLAIMAASRLILLRTKIFLDSLLPFARMHITSQTYVMQFPALFRTLIDHISGNKAWLAFSRIAVSPSRFMVILCKGFGLSTFSAGFETGL